MGIDHFKYSKMKHSIIGWTTTSYCAPEFFEFSLKTYTWSRLAWCTTSICHENVCITPDGRYLLGMGGRNKISGGSGWSWTSGSTRCRNTFTGPDLSDKIVVWDLKNETNRASKVRCPRHVEYSAITRGSNRQQLLTRGFIKRLFKAPAFRNTQLLPEVLIKLTGKFVPCDMLHLMTYSRNRLKELKIDESGFPEDNSDCLWGELWQTECEMKTIKIYDVLQFDKDSW